MVMQLHNQFVPTACPHRSHAIYGDVVACQDYFIGQINKFMNGGTPTNPTPKPPVTVPNPPSQAGAGNPVKADGTRSKALLDEFGQNAATTLYTRGWHLGNYKHQYIIIVDYKTDREIMRLKASGVARADVNKAYGTSGNLGFSLNFPLSKVKGRKMYLLARCTNDPTGNTVGGHSDSVFKEWFLTIPN